MEIIFCRADYVKIFLLEIRLPIILKLGGLAIWPHFVAVIYVVDMVACARL